ncbi:hypothetical protein GALL_204980 [mine drainage metagenome]|uniref:Uncharacterized protein n=1 Tax=mine drainage metagenome TaxID=410659 RepID=A0A1J5RMN1_9ZZZZ
MDKQHLKEIKHELKNIFSAIGNKKPENLIQTISYYLTRSQTTNHKTRNAEFGKSEETEKLKAFIEKKSYWITEIDESNYITEGAEQKVYLAKDGTHVIKLNDSIFYASWNDYINSLLLHNYFFAATNYELIGFINKNNTLFAVVKQPYVISTEPTNLAAVTDFLTENGFLKKKNNDYYNEYLGIILEDLHEQNVLTNNGILFFIDTVFYLTKDFYN